MERKKKKHFSEDTWPYSSPNYGTKKHLQSPSRRLPAGHHRDLSAPGRGAHGGAGYVVHNEGRALSTGRAAFIRSSFAIHYHWHIYHINMRHTFFN